MLDIFTLMRNWFNWCFDNPDIINPNHTALYMFCIEHNNRMGWKTKYGLPTTMAMEAIGIKSYNTYKKTFDDLIKFGFIKLIESSKNQYSSNIIALSISDKALDKALDKATAKHYTKQLQSTIQSTGESNDSIDIHNTIIQNTEIPNTEYIKPETKKPKDLIFTEMVKIWFDWYEFNFQLKPKFSKVDGIKIKSIRTYLESVISAKQPLTDELLFDGFKIVLEYSLKHEFVSKNVSLQIIEMKLNEIIALTTKRPSNKSSKQDDAMLEAKRISELKYNKDNGIRNLE